MTSVQQTGFRKDIQGSYILKDPDAELVYAVDWTDWMEAGDSIITTTFALEPNTGTGLPTLDSPSYLGNIASVTISDGTDGEIYTIANTITTAQGNIDVRRFRIKVEKRYL